MVKRKLVLPNYLTDSHKGAVVKALTLMGVKFEEDPNGKEEVIVSYDESICDVIDDMVLCDYISMV